MRIPMEPNDLDLDLLIVSQCTFHILGEMGAELKASVLGPFNLLISYKRVLPSSNWL